MSGLQAAVVGIMLAIIFWAMGHDNSFRAIDGQLITTGPKASTAPYPVDANPWQSPYSNSAAYEAYGRPMWAGKLGLSLVAAVIVAVVFAGSWVLVRGQQ